VDTEQLTAVAIKRQIVHNATEPCQLAVFWGKLPSMEAEIDCKLQSDSR
jgi:hypothetical protein